MVQKLEIAGTRVTARDLISRAVPTSWPDIFSSDINGVLIRWQYANDRGPCRRDDADRLLIPFAQGLLRKGTQLPISS